jgi:DNA-binding transcriptional LysR family regulator
LGRVSIYRGEMTAQDLSLRHLQALRAVSEHGSYRRAAQALGYSQAAITQQIGALERILGERVFDRHPGPRPVTLNAVGQEVLAAAAEMLDRAELLDARVAALRDGRWGRLAIGTFQSASAALLPGVLAEVRAQEPDVAVSVVQSEDNEELVAAVVGGRLDVTYLVGPVTDDRLTIREVCRDPFVALTAATGATTPTGPVRLADLAGVPLVGHQACVCHDMVERAFRDAGVAATYVFRSNDNAAVQAMVRAGVGTAVMPLLAIDPRDPDIRVSPLDPALPERPILLAVPKLNPAPTAVRFLQRSLAAGLAGTDPRTVRSRRRTAPGMPSASR